MVGKTEPSAKVKGASVTVNTWDSKHGASGMSGFVHAEAKGLNVGHASLDLVIPATPEGVALIEKYCMKDGEQVIPFERSKQMVQVGQTEDGKPEFKEQEVYHVYFSWWPAADGNQKHAALVRNINEDGISERPGAQYGYGEANPNYDLGLEQRTYSGPLGSEKVTLAPHQVVHQRYKPHTTEGQYLQALDDFEVANQKKVQIDLLATKLEKIKNPSSTQGTISKLLDKYCDGWRDDVANPAKITADEAKGLLANRVSPKKKEITDDFEEKKVIKTELKVQIQEAHERKLDEPVNVLRETLALLPPDAHKSTIEEWKKHSPAVVARYESQEINSRNMAAQSVKTLIMTTDLDDNLRNFLFEGTDPPRKEDGSHPYGNPDVVESIRDNWRQFLPEDNKNITKDELTDEILRELRQNAAKVNKELSAQAPDIKRHYENVYYIPPPVLSSMDANYVTAGLQPDNKVELPVGGLNEGESVRPGLNVEPMLARMRDLADNKDKKFSLSTRNCSDTLGKVLEAGVNDPAMKQTINPKNLGGGFGTPQAVHNGAQKAADIYTKEQGKLNFSQKASAKSPTKKITRASGWMLRNTLNKNKSPGVRALSGAALMAMSPITGIAAGINTVAGAISSRVGKSDQTQIDSITPFNQNPDQGRDNAEIAIHQKGIESPEQAIKAFIEQSKQANVIPAFDPETMIAVSRFLTSDACDKTLYDNYMKVANDVMNKAQMEPEIVAPEVPTQADLLERAEEDRFAQLFERDTSATFLPAREQQQSAQQPQDEQKHQSDQKHRRHRSKSAGHDDHSSKPSSPERQRNHSNGHANAFTAMYQSHQRNQEREVSPTLQQRVDEQKPQQPESEKRASSRRRGKSTG